MSDDVELSHQSIHAEYRQALMEAQWALAKANARIKVLERQISENTQCEFAEAPSET